MNSMIYTVAPASSVPFSLNATPTKSWTAEELTTFVSTVGARSIIDQWRIGIAINMFAARPGNKKKVKNWLATTIPQWSNATIYRWRALANTYATEAELLTYKESQKATSSETLKKIAATKSTKIKAYNEATQMIATLEKLHPEWNSEFEQLRKLLLVLQPQFSLKNTKRKKSRRPSLD